MPAIAGAMAEHPELLADRTRRERRSSWRCPAAAAAGWLCGAHLAAVMPNGAVARCCVSRFAAGTIDDGLPAVWAAMAGDDAAAVARRCGDCAAWRPRGGA